MTRNPLVHALVAAGLLAAAGAGAAGLKKVQSASGAETVVAAANVPAAVAPVPPGATPNYRAIVQQAGPAVVGVTVEGTEKVAGGMPGLPPGMENDPFYQFFRGIPGFQGRLPGQRGGEVPVRGQGSGFIISSDGLILTNAHVVRDLKDVTVKLSDRREFKAKVLGTDSVTDIAVLRIDAKGLPTVRLGDAQNLQVGDPVLAIGSPFGFQQTAT